MDNREFEPDRLSVTWTQDYVRGIAVLFCFGENFSGPLGLIWGIHIAGNQKGRSTFLVYHSYVLDIARRHGVRSRLNQALFEDWDISQVFSPAATDEGAAYMRAAGYTEDSVTGMWVLTRETWEATKNPPPVQITRLFGFPITPEIAEDMKWTRENMPDYVSERVTEAYSPRGPILAKSDDIEEKIGLTAHAEMLAANLEGLAGDFREIAVQNIEAVAAQLDALTEEKS